MSGIVFPLLHGNRVIGILSVFLRRRHIFPEDEMDSCRRSQRTAPSPWRTPGCSRRRRSGASVCWNLTTRVVSAQEEERRRLSRELHDETGQALTALRINLGLMGDDVPGDAAALRQRLGEAVTLTDSVARPGTADGTGAAPSGPRCPRRELGPRGLLSRLRPADSTGHRVFG